MSKRLAAGVSADCVGSVWRLWDCKWFVWGCCTDSLMHLFFWICVGHAGLMEAVNNEGQEECFWCAHAVWTAVVQVELMLNWINKERFLHNFRCLISLSCSLLMCFFHAVLSFYIRFASLYSCGQRLFAINITLAIDIWSLGALSSV